MANTIDQFQQCYSMTPSIITIERSVEPSQPTASLPVSSNNYKDQNRCTDDLQNLQGWGAKSCYCQIDLNGEEAGKRLDLDTWPNNNEEELPER